MSEREPQINLNVGGTEYQLRRDNAELYTYMAQLAMFNHVFIEQQNTDNVRTGLFLPQQYVGDEVFNTIAATMLEHEYPARLYQREVSDSDAEIITNILKGKDVEQDWPDWLPPIE